MAQTPLRRPFPDPGKRLPTIFFILPPSAFILGLHGSEASPLFSSRRRGTQLLPGGRAIAHRAARPEPGGAGNRSGIGRPSPGSQPPPGEPHAGGKSAPAGDG